MTTQPRSTTLPDDPFWYKDAIIYELHVRAFSDSNGDGIGDLNGLTEKLDYLCDLGVTALWLLPFYPSPLRDGGYDIADYTGVHENYGTRRDFARLLREAHRRGLRVITELVINHTSSDHPWFQRARRAPAGSRWRDFYVWSDSTDRYQDARIIFKDYETSNWAWDPVAKAYYWHRFYSHQPDLNFDNPEVQAAVFEVLDFWMQMGVDGLRLDAVPYLYEREQTSCENLPETHAFLRKLRAHVDSKYSSRMLLAEANQWPADAAAYFGDGDECHMNFHFPLMPRMFMALQLEDSFPIVNILKQTPQVAPTCQWATFLRNHDELTLEMVTDEDRDTMYRAYAAEATARINLGIRRRLAPLLKVRRKIELMNALLLCLPGTPVLYYGDEIGMGDNMYLGDRDGVRTPMQWSSDRNAGFSRANPQKLYLPTIIDPEYHYEAVNVEAQQSNPSSLLWWMKRLIALRKQHKVFGRGAIDFVPADNARVLAFIREWEGDAVLVVANLSRFAQCVELGLSRFEGMVPVELFGRTRFPRIGRDPYFLSMGPHGFFWLGLEQPAVTIPPYSRRPTRQLQAKERWTSLLEANRRTELAKVILEYTSDRRWFRGKGRSKKGATIADVAGVAENGAYAVVLLEVVYDEGHSEMYVVPLGFATDAEEQERARSANAAIAVVAVNDTAGGNDRTVEGLLFDAVFSSAFAEALLRTISGRRTLGGEVGSLAGQAFKAVKETPAGTDLTPRPLTAEQSNSAILYGNRFILKLFRVLEEGVSIEYELGRFLSGPAGFQHVARLAGALEYKCRKREPSTVAMLQEFVPNQSDAWQLSLDSLQRFFDRVLMDAQRPEVPPRLTGTLLECAAAALSQQVADWLGPYQERAWLLGRRTAELHLALATSTDDPAFTPEPFTGMHQQSLFQSAHSLMARTFDMLRRGTPQMPDEQRELVESLLAREADITRRLGEVARRRIEVDRIRCHGDYHLGQVLWTGDDFFIIDFEGEPARPLPQRRFKRCPLRDVAGMLRSFHYASASALRCGTLRPDDIPLLEPWADAWVEWVSAAYMRGYIERSGRARFLPKTPADMTLLLDFYIAEKSIYEVGYELNNRPAWLEIPMIGLLRLLGPTG